MALFDSHCHFDFAVFDNDREQIWHDANSLGISHLLIPGVAPEQWAKATTIAQQHPNMYTSAGLHPWWIQKNLAEAEVSAYLEALAQQLQTQVLDGHCVAVGECGLDAAISTPIAFQQKVLDVHLQLAHKLCKPLILHCVKAHNELIQQLKQYALPAGGVIHGFSGSYELAASYWAMGFRLGVGGTITYTRANKTRNAMKKMPLEALVLETDAPDMPLAGQQGEANSPINLGLIAQTLADLRGEPSASIAAQTTLNARLLFKLNN